MNRLNRFLSWCCLIGGGAALSLLVPSIMKDMKAVPPGVYFLTAVSVLMAAQGWRNLKKIPPKSAEHASDLPIQEDKL